MKNFVLALLIAFGALGALQVATPTAAYATTATYNPRFLDSSGNPVAGATVTFWNLADPHDSGHILFTSTTDNLGYLYPGVTLTVGNSYYFETTSAAVPNGQFVAPSPQSIVVVPANGGLFLDTSSVAQTKAGALAVTGGMTLGIPLPIGSGGTGATTLSGSSCVQTNSGATAMTSAAGPCVTSVTIGTGLTSSGTSTAPTVALTTPVAIANGGTGATSVTASTCIRAASTTALASAAGDCVTLSPSTQQTGSINVSGTIRSGTSIASAGFTTGDCVNAGAGGVFTDAGFPCGDGAGTVATVTAGTGITVGGTSTNPTVGLTTPVAVANGGTGAAAFTAATCLRATSTTALASAAGDCVTNVTGIGNITSTGGTTPAIAITSSPSFSGTITDTNSLALVCSGTSGCGFLSDATGTSTGFTLNSNGGSTGDLADFQLGGTTKSSIANAGGFVGPSVAVTIASFPGTNGTPTISNDSAAIAGLNFILPSASPSYGYRFFANGTANQLLDLNTTGAAFSGEITAQQAAFSAPGTGSQLTLTDTTGGDTTPNKYLRVSSGALNVVNSGFSSVILSLSDAGALAVTSSITSPSYIYSSVGTTGTALTFLTGNGVWTSIGSTNAAGAAGVGGSLLHMAYANSLGGALSGGLFDIDTAGNAGFAGGVYSASRRALKNNVVPFNSADYLVAHTKIVQFCYKTENCKPGQENHIGFIADDTPSALAGTNHNRFDMESVAATDMAEIQIMRAEIRKLAREIAQRNTPRKARRK